MIVWYEIGNWKPLEEALKRRSGENTAHGVDCTLRKSALWVRTKKIGEKHLWYPLPVSYYLDSKFDPFVSFPF